MKNIALKLFCVVVAVTLEWYVHSRDNSSVISLMVPIEIKNVPEQKVIIWPVNLQVQITVQGPSFLLQRLASSPPPLRVELPPGTEYRHSSQLSSQFLALSPSVRVLNIEPSSVEFRLDDVIERSLPLRVPRLGTLPDNYALSEFTVSPDTVTVSGPSTEISALEHFEGPPVDLRGLEESSELVLQLTPPGRLSEMSPREVRVKVGVSVIKTAREFEGVPVEIRAKSGRRFRIAPESVAVTLSGAESVITALNPESLIAYIRPAEEIEAEQIQVLAEVPAGTTVVRIEPERVVVAAEGLAPDGTMPALVGSVRPRPEKSPPAAATSAGSETPVPSSGSTSGVTTRGAAGIGTPGARTPRPRQQQSREQQPVVATHPSGSEAGSSRVQGR